MKITWLGQAGFLFEVNGMKILIDPYLSESCKKLNPDNFRRMPVDDRYLRLKPDMIILTHNHLDHTDPDTLAHYLTEDSSVTVLASEAAWGEVRKFGGSNNYVKFSRHSEWTENGIRFTAVKAEHSDPHPIGVIIDDSEHKYYITGDTLYNTDIFADIPDDIYALFIAVNGKGNNMNMHDAARFASRIKPRFAVPMHFGLHDSLYPDDLDYKNVIIPEIYKEINFEEDKK